MRLNIIIPNNYELRRETAERLLEILYQVEDETAYRLKGIAKAINDLQESLYRQKEETKQKE